MISPEFTSSLKSELEVGICRLLRTGAAQIAKTDHENSSRAATLAEAIARLGSGSPGPHRSASTRLASRIDSYTDLVQLLTAVGYRISVVTCAGTVVLISSRTARRGMDSRQHLQRAR